MPRKTTRTAKNGQPQKHKTRDEVIKEMTQSKEFQAKMAFIKEQFWPALVEATENIQDAKMLLDGFNTAIMQTFLGRMKDLKLSELGLDKQLDATYSKAAQAQKLLGLFGHLSVFDAKDYIEGMKGEIDLFIREEMEGRSLDTLKVKWLGE